jgi:putative protein kinase ArgK-like GTPase of G3E family
MARALSVTEAVSMKKETLKLTGAWADAFGEPERIGVWFIWGNSGNGKSSFVMQLCKELAKFGRVAYDSLEEEPHHAEHAPPFQHGRGKPPFPAA